MKLEKQLKDNYTLFKAQNFEINDFETLLGYVNQAFKLISKQPHKIVIFDERELQSNLSDNVMYELASHLTLNLDKFHQHKLLWVINPDFLSHMKLIEFLFTKIGFQGKVCHSLEEALDLVEKD